MAESLGEQAEKFANRLTTTVRAVVGEDCPAFFSKALKGSGSDAFYVRQEPASGILLSDPNGPILRMDVQYKCIYDGHKQYMAISESQIRVFVEPNGLEPLFRYEYGRHIVGTLPAAHIQFHGNHPELEQAMADCGDSTSRAKARKRGRKRISLGDLHFPVGGSRFRPTLEDVLEMLIEEFGVQTVGSVRAARKTLADAREDWRRTQVATVVRDAPSEAMATLKELGYKVTPPSPPVEDKRDKLRAL
ncbi:MAG: hypothetical protein KIH64_015575 [Mycobacterium sp.]|nr:hypothetical protein [Mycobacterium sp.]